MKNKIFSFVLGLCAIFALTLPKTTSAYADTTEYTVNYYDTEDTLHNTQTVESGSYLVPPTLAVEDGYKVLWYTSNARDTVYDLNTPVSSNLDLYAGKVEINTIVLMQRHSTDYSTGENEYEYEAYDSVEVIPGSYATVGNGAEVTGYNFSHWSLTPQGSAFNFYNTPINSDIVLYPVYTIKTFTVKFYANGNLYDTKTASYNSTIIPPEYTSNTHVVIGWKKIGGAETSVDFANEYITEDSSYEIILQQVEVNVSVNTSSIYYMLQNSISSTIASGDTLVVQIKLYDEFSHHEVTTADLKCTGDYGDASVNYDETTDIYTIVIFNITSDFSFDLKALPINEYKVTLPEVEGLIYTITTPTEDYSLEGNIYTLNVTKTFTFTVSVQTGFYAKTLAFSNCTNYSGIYSLNDRADVDIVSYCDVVQYHTVTFVGIDNVNLSLVNNYLETNSGRYIYEKGTTANFTATANAGYFVKSVTGASVLNNVYSAVINSDVNIAFNVVESNLVTIVIPTGVENVLVTNYLARNLNEYTVEEGSDIQISYSLAAAYSDSNVTLNSGSYTNTLSGSIFTVYAITDDVTITFENVIINNCTISYVNNEMATFIGANTIDYGSNIVITVVLEDAYTSSVIGASNISITGSYYNYIVNGNEVSINSITSDISIEIFGLEKNIYTLTLQQNVYGSLESAALTMYHGSNITLTPKFELMYDRTQLILSNIVITGDYVNYTVLNNVVTIINAKSDLTVSLKDLEINKYFISLPPVQPGKFSLSTISKNVNHGESLTFSVTINENCSQNADTFTVYKNGHRFAGTRNGLVYTYTLENIVEDVTFTSTNLNLNTYTVDFIDTSVYVDDDGVKVHPTLKTSVVEYGTEVVAIDPTKTGYEFVNWYANEDCDVVFDFTQPITQNTQIFAKYEIRVYEVTFVANGIVVETVVAYSGDDPEEIAPEIPVREGYTQVAPYWDFAAVGFNAVVFKDATVNAVYTINTYTVKFMTPFSQTPLNTQTVNHGGNAVAPTNTNVTGYTFAYWDNSYENITEDTIVNAIYEINTYTITFINGNTGNKVYEAEANYNTTIERPDDSSIVKLGFTVYGWYTDAAMTAAYNFNSSIKNDFTLYGNIDVTKLTLRFVIDGNVILQEEVAYDKNYTKPFPEIPEKTGYTVVGWSQPSVEGLVTDLDVVAVYEINTYTVTFKYSDGTEEKVTVNYGTTITELPNKGKGFGVKVSADMSKLRNIDSDREVTVTITNYGYLIYIACGVVALGLIATVIILSLRVKTSGVIMKQATKEKPAKQEQSEEE